MSGIRNQQWLLSGAVLALLPSICCASPVKITLQPAPIQAQAKSEETTEVRSGMALALHNPMLQLALDYNVLAQVDDEGLMASDSAAQQLGARLHSSTVDRLLSGTTQVKAESIYKAGNDQYTHLVNPTHSRALLGLATLDLGYKFGMRRAAASTWDDYSHAYTFGLRGSLPWGMNWSGGYTTANKVSGQNSKETLVQSLKLRSDYRVSPAMKVQLFSDIKEKTRLTAASEVRSAETRVGAGLSWKPSPRYAVDLKLGRKTLADTGEANFLGRGALSWFPKQGMAISLEYGEQLIEGTRGLVLNTKLDLDRF